MHEGEALRLEDEAAAALVTLRDKPQDVTLLSTWDVFFACPFFGAAVSHPLQTLMRRRISPSGEGSPGKTRFGTLVPGDDPADSRAARGHFRALGVDARRHITVDGDKTENRRHGRSQKSKSSSMSGDIALGDFCLWLRAMVSLINSAFSRRRSAFPLAWARYPPVRCHE